MKIILRNQETLTGLVCVGFSLYLFWEIQNFATTDETLRSLGPHVIPNILTTALLGLGAALYISGLRKPEAPLLSRRYSLKDARVPLLFVLGTILFNLGVSVIGFCVWAVLYLGVVQYFMQERNFKRGALLAMIITGVIFAIFVVGLNVPLPVNSLGF